METVQANRIAPTLTSRPRADETLRHLEAALASGEQFSLDLAADIVSMSFLDQLVLRLQEHRRLGQVIFAIHDADTKNKLARIAEVRQAEILYQGVDASTPRKIEARPSTLAPWKIESSTRRRAS